MRKGLIFVVVQFICIIFLFKTTIRVVFSWVMFVQILAILLGLLAIYEANKSRVSIFPELKEGAKLVDTGPYRYIRHPMYTSILLFFLPAVLTINSILVFVVYGILLFNLILKLNYEEQILMKEFDLYSSYREKTYRLVPYVY